MEGVFASMAVMAAVIILLPKVEQKEDVSSSELKYNWAAALMWALAIGFFGGIVGAGGGFLLVPVMLYFLNIPLRIIIGSNMGIIFFTALAIFIGKGTIGQIQYFLALALVIGAVPGAQLGGMASKRVNVKSLRLVLDVIIIIIGVKMWYGIILS